MPVTALAAATLIVALAGTGVAGGSATAAATPASASAVTVSINDFFFSPTPLTVRVGDTVTWVNNGDAYHSATARNGSFDTEPFAPDASSSYTFTKIGTYAYFCEVHPFMHGRVKVRR